MIVNIEVKKERLDEFAKVIKYDAKGSRKEPGCCRFDVFYAGTNSQQFTFVEVYKNKEAVEFHKQQKHYKAWSMFKKNEGLVTQKPNQKFKGFDYTMENNADPGDFKESEDIGASLFDDEGNFIQKE